MESIDTTHEKNIQKLRNLLLQQKTIKPDNVDLNEIIKDKTKYDIIPDNQKKPISIVFIGHVDAGKSTTCGNILLMTQQVTQSDVMKLKKEAKLKNRESWWIAYLLDDSEEERNKGITTEVGKAEFQTPNRKYTIYDAPGHKNYVPNMITGVSQADVAALVISAKNGEFEAGFEKGGQTAEHAILARSMGVQTIILLINKMDDVMWCQERYNYIKNKLTVFLNKQCGFKYDNIHCIPYSGLTGENMSHKITDPAASWYQEQTMFELFDNLDPPQRNPCASVRFPIIDKFKDGSNLFVYGKLLSGTITHTSKLILLPMCENITVHSILNNQDQRIPYALPGDNVKLVIKGIDNDFVNRGDIISNNHDLPFICNQFEADIILHDLPEHKPLMSIGYSCIMHLHTSQIEVEIIKIKSSYNRNTKSNESAKFLKKKSRGTVIISAKNNLLSCEKEIDFPQLGRFSLRDEGKTIGFGKILRVKPLINISS